MRRKENMAKKKKAKEIGATDEVANVKERKILTSEEIISAIKKDKELNKLVINPETMKYEWLNTNVISLNLVFSGKIRFTSEFSVLNFRPIRCV